MFPSSRAIDQGNAPRKTSTTNLYFTQPKHNLWFSNMRTQGCLWYLKMAHTCKMTRKKLQQLRKTKYHEMQKQKKIFMIIAQMTSENKEKGNWKILIRCALAKQRSAQHKELTPSKG